MIKWQYLTGLRYAEIKPVKATKQGKQHDNERKRGDKILTINSNDQTQANRHETT